MNDIHKILNEKNVSTLVRDILLSQDLSVSEVDEILNDKEFVLDKERIEPVLERIRRAKRDGEKVMVAGDYDADGISATTILVKGLRKFGIDPGFYIPDRLKEGYGLHADTVDLVSEKGYSLIITVDNGVVAYEALNRAKKLGVDVIVTDHHTLDLKEDYNFDYLLHSSLLNEGFQDLCGAGLALVLMESLLAEQVSEFYVYAMVATLADMVSVFGYNRYIIKKGLKILNEEGNVYIEHLIHYNNGPINQETISFQVVPKLNSAGRLADHVNVNNIVRYFLLDNIVEIEKVAKAIQDLNRKRIDMTNAGYKALAEPKQYGLVNVLKSHDIHEGLTGLVANKYLNDVHEPVLVLSLTDGVYKGSGRAPAGFDLYATLKPNEALFETFGGHKQACGFSFKEENFDAIFNSITTLTRDLSIEPVDEYFIELDAEAITIQDVNELDSLAPYGTGFKKPLFKVHVNTDKKPFVMGGRHLKWTINNQCEVLMFSLSPVRLEKYQELQDFEAYVSVSLNEFRGNVSVSMIVDKVIGDSRD